MRRALSLILVVAGATVGVGAFLNWFGVTDNFHSVWLKGNQAGGQVVWFGHVAPAVWTVTGAVALVLVGVLAALPPSPRHRQIAGVVGVLVSAVVGIVAFLEYQHASDAFHLYLGTNADAPVGVHAVMGSGLLLTFVGCGVAFVISFILAVSPTSTATAPGAGTADGYDPAPSPDPPDAANAASVPYGAPVAYPAAPTSTPPDTQPNP
jgi:hypothetical protein